MVYQAEHEGMTPQGPCGAEQRKSAAAPETTNDLRTMTKEMMGDMMSAVIGAVQNSAVQKQTRTATSVPPRTKSPSPTPDAANQKPQKLLLCKHVEKRAKCPFVDKPGGCKFFHPEKESLAEYRQREKASQEAETAKPFSLKYPDLTREICIQHKICMQWARNGQCLLPDCQYKHKIPDELQQVFDALNTQGGKNAGEEEKITAMFMSKISKSDLGPEEDDIPLIYNIHAQSVKGMVLLDTGANEVVRPSNWKEWAQIEAGKPGTKLCTVKLAGGTRSRSGMTAM